MTDGQVKAILDEFERNANSAQARMEEAYSVLDTVDSAGCRQVMKKANTAGDEMDTWKKAAAIVRRVAGEVNK